VIDTQAVDPKILYYRYEVTINPNDYNRTYGRTSLENFTINIPSRVPLTVGEVADKALQRVVNPTKGQWVTEITCHPVRSKF
jgi:hypothetical protein